MQVHHINCGAMQPYGGGLFDGITPGLGPCELACHCLVVEHPDGLVLVDTGVAAEDEAQARAAQDPTFRTIDRPRTNPAESAAVPRAPARAPRGGREAHRDDAPGLRPRRRAGGLPERHRPPRPARRPPPPPAPSGPKARARYRPHQWGSTRNWRTATPTVAWFGLSAAPVLGPDLLLVSLPGHTEGHCGVAVRQGAGWLLHAGDAIFFRSELAPVPHIPNGARAYEWMMQVSQVRRRRSLAALRRLVHGHPEVRVVCTHDPHMAFACAAIPDMLPSPKALMLAD